MISKRIRKLIFSLALSSPLTGIYDRLGSEKSLGKRGELAAERFLLRKGYVIIQAGYQDKIGELDLIVVDGRTVVFVEVKTRTSDVAGAPAEAVDAEKQARITKTARGYLKWNRLTECDVRFDVIGVVWPENAQRPRIQHFENAFEAVGDYQMY